jgi:Putative beta barrel porin-7 (BBP7)
MSVRKLTASLFMTLAMLGVGNNAVQAQEYFPVADPFAFDPDFRWFEPIYDADLADMKPNKRANSGWYATYDRLNLYGSRPELNDANASDTKIDGGWGHRYEVGYMLPADDNGWQFNWTSLDVNQNFIIEQERLNRYNLQNIGGGGAGGGGAQPIDPRFPADGRFTIPVEDRNNPGEFRRVYFIRDSENVFSFNNYELNKTWRMEPYHYGGILEPLVGFRWMRFSDDNTRQNYTTLISIDPFFPGAAEQLITDTVITDNELLTGQVGFRYTKYRDRFTFASDFRVFTGGSLQCATTTQTIDTTIYGGTTVAPGATPDFDLHDATTPRYVRNEEFVIGFDVRGEVNYQLTKMITVRAGFQVIDLATGIWRGGPGPIAGGGAPTGGDRDQDVVMVGGTFGITLNR